MLGKNWVTTTVVTKTLLQNLLQLYAASAVSNWLNVIFYISDDIRSIRPILLKLTPCLA